MCFRISVAFRPVLMLAVAAGMGSTHAAPYRDDITFPSATYAAHIYAYGEGSATTDVYQDELTPYADHHSVLNPATWELQNTVVRYAGSYDDYAKSTTTNDHGGTVQVDVHTNNYLASSTASLTFYFTVIGPDRDYVPISISGYGRADASSESGWDSASVSMSVNYRETGHNYFSTSTEAFGNHEGGTFSDVLNIQPNLGGALSNRVILEATTWVGIQADPFDNSGFYGGIGSAYIDPVFSIADPAVAPYYRIVIGMAPAPAAPVPEAAGGAMMFAGLGVVACALRRSRRRAEPRVG